MWINVVKSTTGGNNNNNNNMQGRQQKQPLRSPPSRPASSSTTTTTTTTSTTTAAAAHTHPFVAPPAALVISPVPAATPPPASRAPFPPPTPASAEAKKRWLGVGRTEQQQQQPPSTSSTIITTTSTQLPVTPPSKFKRLKIFIKWARKERRKKEEKQRSGATDSSNSMRDNREKGGQRTTSPRAHTAGNEVDYCIPSRRSFRLTAAAPNSHGQNMLLPLWLEEKPGLPSPNPVNEVSNVDVNISSFETRWDSLRHAKNKVHSSSCHHSCPQPPGWDDIGNPSDIQYNNTGNSKKNYYSPPFNVPNNFAADSTNRYQLLSLIQQTHNMTTSGNDLPHAISLSTSSIMGSSRKPAVPPPTSCTTTTTAKDTLEPPATPSPTFRSSSNLKNKQLSDSLISETKNSPPLPIVSFKETQQRPAWCDEFSAEGTGTQQHDHFSDSSSWENVLHTPKASTNLNFSDSYLGARRHSDPLSSNMASGSAVSSLASGYNASTKVIDHHLWASSDSFFCEDFTFCNNRKGKVTSEDQPRSYSQVLLRENQSENSDDLSQTSEDNEPSQQDFFSPCDTPEGMTYYNTVTGHKEVPDTPPLDRLSLGESIVASVSPDSPQYRTQYSERDAINKDTFNINHHNMDLAQPGREHWIQFDGSSQDQLNLDLLVARGVFRPPPLSLNLVQSKIPPDSQASDASAAVTPSSPGENCKSILSMEESAGVVHSSGSYRGRLIRTCSQRGRRASQRVMNSVSRRVGQTTQDYSKVPEPKPPMYSRAAMTMDTGPGLFEQPTITCDNNDDEEGGSCAEAAGDEMKVSNAGKTSSLSTTATASRSFLETANKAERVGSLRMPRLSTALVRRSLSLNSPRVERGEVPFQRLSTEHRPGSFRKAISGLGAHLARSFRHKSNFRLKVDSPDGSKNTSNSIQASKSAGNEPTSHETLKSVQHAGSFRGGSRGIRQTPQAPRLPRRTIITHKSVESDNPRRPPLQI